ncbi:transcriptional regulator TetR family [Methanobrevibacter ruminantium M1]|uniref:Transcriptional regulator TetR family n=1 Tax=Methanobrevibacter ruminantium (strain ATCC 35063 / DSM 1093 / JCM 13430 / OCM 146 / M1) TaxID=634498 RepID=D3DYS4_METRM|nr:TetR/AcrR family transcriptional regulator [Methanobrevibacter ruminantium]ADC45994.1 transcriptional regulator TetR family [Methanobrevibacter ruminantium M1]
MLFEKENTEEKIIRATFDIVQREGLQKATTKKIAAEAGVNEVTIFRKFENKKNLIKKTKEYYTNQLIAKLEESFEFNETDSIEEYLKRSFNKILEFSEEDFNIIRVAMQEVKNDDDKKLLITTITDTIINKLDEFFKLQLEKGTIKDLNSKAVSLMCFSIIFQSLILWQIYNDGDLAADYYADEFLDIIFNGIKVQ